MAEQSGIGGRRQLCVPGGVALGLGVGVGVGVGLGVGVDIGDGVGVAVAVGAEVEEPPQPLCAARPRASRATSERVGFIFHLRRGTQVTARPEEPP